MRHQLKDEEDVEDVVWCRYVTVTTYGGYFIWTLPHVTVLTIHSRLLQMTSDGDVCISPVNFSCRFGIPQ